MQTSVSLQPVAAVPVTTRLYELLCAVDVLLDKELVIEEQSYPDDGQDNVDLGAQDASLLKQLLELFQLLLLVSDFCIELCTLALRGCNLSVAGISNCIVLLLLDRL